MRLTIALLLLATPAVAQTSVSGPPPSALPPTQTYDMTTQIKGLGDKPIPDPQQATQTDPQCLKCDPMTYGIAIERFLFLGLPGDAPAPTQMGQPQALTDDQSRQQTARWFLADRIHDKAAVTFSDKERLGICKRAKAARYGMAALRVIQLLCPTDGDFKAEVE